MSLRVASLHIHPIKSLGGFSVQEARITDRGFEHDRRWMLVDANGRFISQREVAQLACLHCTPTGNGFQVTDIRSGRSIDLPWTLEDGSTGMATVWDDHVAVRYASETRSSWFSEQLGISCTLVYMPQDSSRAVDARYAEGITSLSDGYPYLIISQASLDDLNGRLERQIPMDRFRPNIVIAGGEPFQEDVWREVELGGARFALVKPCARCVITTTDQHTGERSAEPLRTLATYRRRITAEGVSKVDFGMNAMARGGDMVRVGDLVGRIVHRTAP